MQPFTCMQLQGEVQGTHKLLCTYRRTCSCASPNVGPQGSTNRNESGTIMYNQCFYLSLARAFLREDGHGGEPQRNVVQETALHFKRVIETAVLRAHPEWAETQVGEDLQAFSDFLFYILSGSNAMLSELAVAVFDSTSGGVEVYRGAHYPGVHGRDSHFLGYEPTHPILVPSLVPSPSPSPHEHGRKRSISEPTCSACVTYPATTRRCSLSQSLTAFVARDPHSWSCSVASTCAMSATWSQTTEAALLVR